MSLKLTSTEKPVFVFVLSASSFTRSYSLKTTPQVEGINNKIEELKEKKKETIAKKREQYKKRNDSYEKNNRWGGGEYGVDGLDGLEGAKRRHFQR